MFHSSCRTFCCRWQCPPVTILLPIFTFCFCFSFWSTPLSVLSSTNSLQIHLLSIPPKSDCQKTCCRPLLSGKIHTFTSLSCGMPFSVHIFTLKELGTRCSSDFACMTAGELSSTVTNCLTI